MTCAGARRAAKTPNDGHEATDEHGWNTDKTKDCSVLSVFHPCSSVTRCFETLRMSEPYLPRLTARLASGLSRLPAARRDRHARYLRAAQNPDGGFSGREGGSDLYYTGFALRGLAVLGALSPDVCGKAAAFLRASLTQQTSVIDFFSLLYSCLLVQAAGGTDVLSDSAAADWPDRVAAALEGFRTPDGGYAKGPGGTAAAAAAGSTYHSFLVALCYELIGRPVPD